MCLDGDFFDRGIDMGAAQKTRHFTLYRDDKSSCRVEVQIHSSPNTSWPEDSIATAAAAEMPTTISPTIAAYTEFFTFHTLPPEYRDDSKTCYADPCVRHEGHAENSAQHRDADSAGNSYCLTDPPLAP
jgi:hypothetical protein